MNSIFIQSPVIRNSLNSGKQEGKISEWKWLIVVTNLDILMLRELANLLSIEEKKMKRKMSISQTCKRVNFSLNCDAIAVEIFLLATYWTGFWLPVGKSFDEMKNKWQVPKGMRSEQIYPLRMKTFSHHEMFENFGYFTTGTFALYCVFTVTKKNKSPWPSTSTTGNTKFKSWKCCLENFLTKHSER